MKIESINEDWGTVKQRWEAWWEQQLHDRVLICVTAPRDGAVQPPQEEVAVETHWTDSDYAIRTTLATVQRTYYGGDALPVFMHGWSVGHSLCFGCTPHFARDTVWVDPAPTGDDGFPSLEGWRQSPWWDWMRRSTLSAARASRGRYFVPPMWGNQAGDTLAMVRGSQELLMDIALNPDWVRSAIQRMSDILLEIFEELWTLVSPDLVGLPGSVNYVNTWSSGRTMGLDCDMSCMISPQTFADLFLPALVEHMRTLDRRIYHLDGPGAIQHLDLLLELPELEAIQWVPGAGHEGVLQWVPLIRRIQAKGKSIVVYARPGEIEPLLREVEPEGLCVSTSCRSEAEARQLVERASRMSQERIR
ncbi:MAG TPA: hypothetical protein VM221_11655 [Armatimonadota bacterium]|nr:hypothetical protein [Armatimonadota bacterium]